MRRVQSALLAGLLLILNGCATTVAPEQRGSLGRLTVLCTFPAELGFIHVGGFPGNQRFQPLTIPGFDAREEMQLVTEAILRERGFEVVALDPTLRARLESQVTPKLGGVNVPDLSEVAGTAETVVLVVPRLPSGGGRPLPGFGGGAWVLSGSFFGSNTTGGNTSISWIVRDAATGKPLAGYPEAGGSDAAPEIQPKRSWEEFSADEQLRLIEHVRSSMRQAATMVIDKTL